MDREIETAALQITGLTDVQRCKSVRSALEAIHGVLSAEVHSEHAQVVVVYDPTRVIPRQLRVAVGAMGCRVEAIVLPSDSGEWPAIEPAWAGAGLSFVANARQRDPFQSDADLSTYLG